MRNTPLWIAKRSIGDCDLPNQKLRFTQKFCDLAHPKLRNGHEKSQNEPKNDARTIVLSHGYPRSVEVALLRIAEAFAETAFSNADIVKLLGCAMNSATGYIKRLRDELKLIEPIKGLGRGKFRFMK